MLPAVSKPLHVTPEALNVAADLVGRPLAPPGRRAAAMALDLLVVAVLSSLSNLWLGLGLLLVALQLRSAAGGGSRLRRTAGWLLVALFTLLAARELWLGWRERQEPKAPPAAEAAAEAGDEKTAGDTLHKIGEGLPDAERIKLLEAAVVSLAKNQKPKAGSFGDEVERLLDAVGASFGWGVVYFSLLPAFWPGQTIGKKLFRLQVLELTGQPMTVMRSLKRYGGYAAGMATGGLGFTQLLWDPNRQAIQDRAAHTVVVDLRAPPLSQP